jgi:hypothetical protein
MPYNPHIAHLRTPTKREQVLTVFGFAGLIALKDVLAPIPATLPAPPKGADEADDASASPVADDPATRGGRRPGPRRRASYPPLLQYAVAVTARIYGSQRQALQHLKEEGLWQEATDIYTLRTGIEEPLPDRPPTEDQQNDFVHRLTKNPDLMRRLSEAFTATAVAQAKSLGNFPDGGTPDFAAPDPRNTVFGDGTWYPAFSKVRSWLDNGSVVVFVFRL